MPIFDKPLSELSSYLGTNPRPDDFDAYWDRAKVELDTVSPDPTFTPNHAIRSNVAHCFDLRFTGIGGATIYAKYLCPKGHEGPRPTILKFHGYSANSGDWTDYLGYVGEGCCVAAMDCRGQGGLSEDRGGVRGTTLKGHIIRGLDDPDPNSLLYRQIFLDTVQLARSVTTRPEVDPTKLSAVGGSQGGALALVCAALEPRITRVASQFPFLCDYQRVWEMDLAENAYEELRLFFRRHDPRHERKTETFTKLGYIDCQNLAPRIKCPVLMLTGLMDRICPPSTQFAAYNKIGGEKEMILYPDFGHETLPNGDERIFNFLTAPY